MVIKCAPVENAVSGQVQVDVVVGDAAVVIAVAAVAVDVVVAVDVDTQQLPSYSTTYSLEEGGMGERKG